MGTPVSDVCRRLGVSEATFYVWKKKYGNLGVSRKLPHFIDNLGVELSGRMILRGGSDDAIEVHETQIVAVLKEAGVAVKEVCRRCSISDATYYNWKARYGGLGVSELMRLKGLDAENMKLKRMYTDLALGNEAIKAVLNRKL